MRFHKVEQKPSELKLWGLSLEQIELNNYASEENSNDKTCGNGH